MPGPLVPIEWIVLGGIAGGVLAALCSVASSLGAFVLRGEQLD